MILGAGRQGDRALARSMSVSSGGGDAVTPDLKTTSVHIKKSQKLEVRGSPSPACMQSMSDFSLSFLATGLGAI